MVEATASRVQKITWLGTQPAAAVHQLMQDARCVIFPSITFETFGQVIAEAFATGAPVVASDGGAARELVAHGRTGLLFRSGDPVSLATQVATLARDARACEEMGAFARAHYTNTFTAAANYRALFNIYAAAIARAGARFQPGRDRQVAA
jgi:glycosyltransferase involved in cell wall biosynthesis